MNPWELVNWGLAIGVSVLVASIPIGLAIGVINLFRRDM